MRALGPTPGGTRPSTPAAWSPSPRAASASPERLALAISGAARAGAGMVRCVAPQEVLDLVLRARPEIVGHRDRAPVDLEDVGTRRTRSSSGPGLG